MQPVVLENRGIYENHGIDSRYTGPHKVAPTVTSRYGSGGGNVPLTLNPSPVVYSFDSTASNSMKSSNPYSGCREVDTARTIDTTVPCPSKNQGGIAILQDADAYAIAGNIIGRKTKNGGNGLGIQKNIAPTLTSIDRPAVYSQQRSDEYIENDVVCTQAARQYKDATDLVYQSQVYGQAQYGGYTDGCTTLRASGGDHGGGSENLVLGRNLIRRLTPTECERLMDYPDGWTDIPGATDSKRYKALGNSVVVSCMEYVLRGIAYFLRKDGE